MTVEEQRRAILLLSAIELSGGGTKARVLDNIATKAYLVLGPRDLAYKHNRHERVWRNELAYVRKHLVQEGYFADIRRDWWAVTDAGRRYLGDLARRLPHTDGDAILSQHAMHAIRAARSARDGQDSAQRCDAM